MYTSYKNDKIQLLTSSFTYFLLFYMSFYTGRYFLQIFRTSFNSSILLVSQFSFVNYSPNLSFYLKNQSKNLINITKFCLDAPYSLWRGGVIWVILMKCFCDTVDRQKMFSLISSRDHCQGSSHSKSLTCLNLHRT